MQPKRNKSGVRSDLMVRDYRSRREWQEKTEKSGDVWAFYNNGQNLYVEPFNQPATTYYNHRWQRMPFRQFFYPRRFKSLSGKCAILQSLGHGCQGIAYMVIGCNESQVVAIPPLHILYMRIESEVKMSSLRMQFQPLPGLLVPLVKDVL